MDDKGYDAPNAHISCFSDRNGPVARMLCFQSKTIIGLGQTLQCEVAINNGHDHQSRLGCRGSIHDQQIAVVDARPREDL